MNQIEQKYSMWLVVFLGMLTAVAPLATDMYLPALPIMPAEFNTSASSIQLTLTMTMVGMALGQVIGGPISDSVGRKLPLFVGNLLCLAASLLCAYATSIEMLLFARFMQGVTGSISIVVAKAVARDLATGQALTKLYATLMMVNGLAPIIAPLLGGAILVYADWRMVFVVLAGICFLLMMGSFFFKESLPVEKRISGGLSETLHSFRILAKDKPFMGQCLIQWFAFGAFFAYISGSSFVYQNVFDLSALEFSYVFGINSCAIVVASYISGKVSNVYSTANMLQWSLWQFAIGGFLFLLAIIFELSLIITTIILLLAICTVSVFGAASFSMALSSHGKIAGSASALLGFFSMASAGLMAPLVGIAGSDTGVPMGIVMTVSASLALITYYVMVAPSVKKGKQVL